MPEVQVMEVDAATAREWLSHNENNRPISLVTVAKYAMDMERGRWFLSTDSIGFDVTGRLVQGQHRLSALVQADTRSPGIVVPFLITTGLHEDTFHVLDQGRMRYAGHVLGTYGLPSTTVTAAVIRQLLFYDRFPDDVWSGSEAISRVEVIETALANRQALISAGVNARTPRRPINKTTYCLLHYLVNRDSEHSDRWDDFDNGVYYGENLSPGSPLLALRNGQTAATWGMNGAQPRLGAYIKAWNAFVTDREIRLLAFRKAELPMPRVQ